MKNFRIFDILDYAVKNFPDKKDLFAGKEDGNWKKYSAHDYKQISEWVAIGLLGLGVSKGDKVATVSNNRPEWNFIDMGVSQIGAIHTPIYPTLTLQDFEYILKHSEATVFIVSDSNLYNKLKPVVDNIKNIKHFFSIDQVEGVKNWYEIVDSGKKNYDKSIEKLEKIKSKIKTTDLLTLIYTSGTTNDPKGVLLTHGNFTYQIIKIKDKIDLDNRHVALSFLPLCHVLERVVNYMLQYLGVSIYYAEGLNKLAENLQEINPHMFATVPRVIERFYDKIIAKGSKLSAVKKSLFFGAVKHAEKFEFSKQNNVLYKSKLSFYDKLIFSQWRKALGGRIKFIISGGAALSPRLNRIFWAAGMPIREGYGLTETAPVISLNNMPPEARFGTVGKKIGEEQDVAIAEDGEIIFKGPNLMEGYYKAKDLTEEAIDKDGWFHTGDMGKIDDDGFVKITGRKKEIFKLSNGKYISPAIIENLFIESILIEQMMVVGNNEKFAGALISPNFEVLHAYAAENNISYRDNKELVAFPQINSLIKKEVILLNKQLAQFERVNTFKVVCDEWSPATGELSPTLKKKRYILEKKYEQLIKNMFRK